MTRIILLIIVLSGILSLVQAQPNKPVYLREGAGCNKEIIDAIYTKCIFPLGKATDETFTSTLTQLCSSTSECQVAQSKLKLQACARVYDVNHIIRLEMLLPIATTMCLKNTAGEFCRQRMKADPAYKECKAIKTKEACRLSNTCMWLRSCMRRPLKSELDNQCGECNALVSKAKANVLGYVAASKRTSPEAYDILGLMDKKPK